MRLVATIDVGLPPGQGAAACPPPDPAVLAGELYEALRSLGATSVAVAVQRVEEDEGEGVSFDEEGGGCTPGDERGGRSRGEYDFGEDLGDDF
jgi:hypothetical protein